MINVLIESSSHPYKVFIGEQIRFHLKKHLNKQYKKIMIITDDNVAPFYLDDLLSNFSLEDKVESEIIPHGEKSKSIEKYYELQTELMKQGLDRKALVIALGGGVIGDLAGFVAATYMRGIDYIQIPTTILAHDSSVGGKVAINHERGKNMIGCFYPPQAVIYDVDTLKSLPANEIRSGYAELVKEALIADESFFHDLMEINVEEVKSEQLEEHLQLGIEIKASVVEADEHETGVRMHLNFGHTLAHALEAELGYGEITHGEAVAIGMLFALRVSEAEYGEQLPFQTLFHWLKKNRFPLHINNLRIDDLIRKMKLDKKTVNEKIKMVLLKRIGNPMVVEIDDETLRSYLKLFMKELVKE